MILPHNNKQLARQYFETLQSQDESRQYYEGKKYEPPKTLISRFYNSLFIQTKIDQLEKFYPYQKTVQATVLDMKEDQKNYLGKSFVFSAVSWTALFFLGRSGVVLPVLKEYGSWFQSHRLFRHYLYALILPLLYGQFYYRSKWLTHIESLWIVHANRLNAKILDDPLYTYYPKSVDNTPYRTVNIRPQFHFYEPLKTHEDEAE